MSTPHFRNVLPAEVHGLFDLMKIAEEEIARGGADAFAFLCPPPGFTSLDERVYRAHARELVERVKRGERLEDGTKAEVMVLLSQQTLLAPPTQQYAALYEKLFAEIFGTSVEGEPAREPWPKASEELLADLRRKAGLPRSRRDLDVAQPPKKPAKKRRAK